MDNIHNSLNELEALAIENIRWSFFCTEREISRPLSAPIPATGLSSLESSSKLNTTSISPGQSTSIVSKYKSVTNFDSKIQQNLFNLYESLGALGLKIIRGRNAAGCPGEVRNRKAGDNGILPAQTFRRTNHMVPGDDKLVMELKLCQRLCERAADGFLRGNSDPTYIAYTLRESLKKVVGLLRKEMKSVE
jgi:hypothetical protein